jgi:peptidoglycan/LPS O-acetylase OafA/YrhL
MKAFPEIFAGLRSFRRRLEQQLKRVTSSGNYIPEVDGLRFLAILPVVIQHLSERVLRSHPQDIWTSAADQAVIFWASRGTTGVFLFFLISGFILSLPFAKRRLEKAKKPSLKKYFFRRITRLEPPYIIWMVVFFIVLLFTGRYGWEELSAHLGASLLYSHNWIYQSYSIINPVAWSLEIEIQFYLIAPFLVWALFGISHKLTRRITLLLLIVGFISLQHTLGWQKLPFKISLLGQLQYFLAGIFLADIYLDKQLLKSERKSFIWDIIGVAFLLLALLSWSEEYLKSLLFTLCLMLSFVAVFKGNLLKRFFRLRWIALTGSMCYTIYLIHLSFLEAWAGISQNWIVADSYGLTLLIHFALLSPVLLLLTIISYLLLEKPFMKPDWPLRFWKSIKNPALLFGRPNAVDYSFLKIKLKKIMNTRIILIKLFLFCAVLPLYSQYDEVGKPYISSGEAGVFEVKPLDRLLAIALENAVSLQTQEVRKKQLEQDMKLVNRKWLDYFSLTGSFQFGTGQFLDATQTSENLAYRLTDRRNAVYRVGATVQLPLSSFFTREPQLEKLKGEIVLQQLEQEELKDLVRKQVILHYTQLQEKVKRLEIKAEAMEFNRVAARTAEKYFQQGNLDLADYSQLIANKTRSEEDFEKIKAEAWQAFLLLKEAVGSDIRPGQDLSRK